MSNVKELTDIIREGNNSELQKKLNAEPSLAKEKTEQGISLFQFSVYCRNKAATDILRPLIQLDVFEAASVGDFAIVQKEIKKNPASINSFAADGFTPLGLACFFGQYEVVEFLLRNGADTNIASINSFKVAPIHSACAISHFKITNLLLQHGADVNARQQNDVTPLHETAHNGKTELTQLLLNHGANKSAKTTSGQTPFDMAVEKGFVETAELLK